MASQREHGEGLFSEHFDRIESTIRSVAARRRLDPDERDELYSLVMLKLIQDDYAILRGFRGSSGWASFLWVVVERVLLDHRVAKWGRWRPCVKSRRLGTTAVLLDRRINRDGLAPSEAIRDLSMRGVDETPRELERLAAKIPRRSRRRLVSGDAHLQKLADPEEADRRLQTQEQRKRAKVVRRALVRALRDLPDTERRLLDMRFARGWTVRKIAADQDLEERRLYRRFAKILRELRQRLEGDGLDWRQIAPAIEGSEVDVEITIS